MLGARRGVAREKWGGGGMKAFGIAVAVALAAQGAASAQGYFYNAGGGPGWAYGNGFGPMVGYRGPSLAGRTGPMNVTWYNAMDGYSQNVQTGLPWRFGSAPGTIAGAGRVGTIAASGSVGRYSRTGDPNYYYARADRATTPPSLAAVGDRSVLRAAGGEQSAPATRKRKTTASSAAFRAAIRARGGADWVYEGR